LQTEEAGVRIKTFNSAIVIGSSGFIGAHLCRVLEEKGIEEIHKIDIKAAPSIDIRKPFDIESGFDENAVIFNLAAVHRTPGHKDREYFEANILGAENVCVFAKKHGIKTIVFTSSISPYGTGEEQKTEETLPAPNTPYGISKLVAEHIHREWAASSQEHFLSIARPGIVFGKGENGNMMRLYKALKKRRFAYAGRKDTIKASIYVKDLARILLEMAESPKERVQTYNFTYFPAPTIKEIAETMNRITGLNRRIPYIPKIPLMAAASVAGALGGLGLGICPERVRKLMVSTNVSGEKLSRDYPLRFSLEEALADWLADCGGRGLE
jgi:nucleoside-diphosphate-sugar epimerase